MSNRITSHVKITRSAMLSRIFIVMMVILVACSVSCKASQTALIGKWLSPFGHTLEFASDGTVMMKNKLTITGSYSVVDSSHVKIDLLGLLAGSDGPAVFQYVINGDKLTLTGPKGIGLTYTRE
jgi:hypothetical protein